MLGLQVGFEQLPKSSNVHNQLIDHQQFDGMCYLKQSCSLGMKSVKSNSLRHIVERVIV